MTLGRLAKPLSRLPRHTVRMATATAVALAGALLLLTLTSDRSQGARLFVPEGAAEVALPMRLVRGSHPVISAVANNDVPVNLLVDTGSPRTLLDPSLFGEDQGRGEDVVTLCFANGICFHEVPVKFAPSPYTRSEKSTYNGILGVDLMRHLPLTIDYPAGKVIFSSPEATADSIEVAFELDENLKPRVDIATGDSVQRGVLLDTGATYTRITPRMQAALSLEGPALYRETAFYVTSQEPTDILNAPEFCLDEMCVTDVPVQIGSWPAVGGTFFRNFRSTFDFDGERLTLDPNPKDVPLPRNGLQNRGLQVELGDPAHVVSVRPGSPADHAGIQVGDRIAEIEGVAVDELGYFGVNARIEEPGPLTLEVLRGNQPPTPITMNP